MYCPSSLPAVMILKWCSWAYRMRTSIIMDEQFQCSSKAKATATESSNYFFFMSTNRLTYCIRFEPKKNKNENPIASSDRTCIQTRSRVWSIHFRDCKTMFLSCCVSLFLSSSRVVCIWISVRVVCMCGRWIYVTWHVCYANISAQHVCLHH